MSYGTPPPQQPGQPPQWQGQQPGWGTPMPPPKKSTRGPLIAILGCSGLLVLGVVIGSVALFASAGGDSSDDAGSSTVSSAPSVSAKSSAPAKEKTAPASKGADADVKITSCEVNASTTWPAAGVEIVNYSSSEANYIVSVEFLDASGTRLGEGMAATNNLAPGQRALEKAQGLSKTDGKITCKVSKVTRYPAG
ncbi:FxLYD domain-containing protein [Streptomyces sp. NPDC005776]|uniref:FxLYD domain-containing protein n=1 Tax=Streptomyces sp. NPDC005776 TaxID=3154676 RepID=UPI0033E97C0B